MERLPIFDEVAGRLLDSSYDPPTERFAPVTQPTHVQTSHPARKTGRLPKHADELAHPRLKLSTFLRTAYKGQVPDVVDYSGRVTNWGMMKNDVLGTCTAADAAHGVMNWTAWGEGSPVAITDDDVLAFYSGSTGYNPADPSTDQGGNMQDVNNYFRKTGIVGRTIEAFFQVDPDDADEVRAALYLFGSVSAGMAFPDTAMEQFDRGEPWSVVRGARLEGGHDVLVVGATKGGNYKVVTWGRVQEVTPAFWRKYMGSRVGGEAWARVEQDWASKAGVAPGNALTVDELNTAFTSLTGQPGPFAAGTPDPAPQPDPTPTPSPEPQDNDAAFCVWLRDAVTKTDLWLRNRGF